MDKLESLHEANKITLEILQSCKDVITGRENILGTEINQHVKTQLTRYGLEASFKGYRDFPYFICVSVNDTVIHGCPNDMCKIIKDDVVSLDFGVKVNGYHGDSAITFINNKSGKHPNKKVNKLLKDTRAALDDAITYVSKSFPNCKISGITKAINTYSNKYGIIQYFGGHGVGLSLHDGGLFIPNSWATFEIDRTLVVGECFAIEPMFTLGSEDTFTDEDGFSEKTTDGSISAHFEHSMGLSEEGLIVFK